MEIKQRVVKNSVWRWETSWSCPEDRQAVLFVGGLKASLAHSVSELATKHLLKSAILASVLLYGNKAAGSEEFSEAKASNGMVRFAHL